MNNFVDTNFIEFEGEIEVRKCSLLPENWKQLAYFASDRLRQGSKIFIFQKWRNRENKNRRCFKVEDQSIHFFG